MNQLARVPAPRKHATAEASEWKMARTENSLAPTWLENAVSITPCDAPL
jgi:hypothetical protein